MERRCNPRVGVLVLNWNGLELLKKFIPSWIAHTPYYAELVVVDNGSTDGSVEYLQESYPDIKRLEFVENYGFAEGYNRAIRTLDYPIVILLNSDVELTDGWLSSPLDVLNSNTDIAAVQPKIMSYTQPDYFEYAGGAGGYLDRLGYPFCRGRLFDCLEQDQGQYDDIVDIFWASGACLIIRRDVYLEVGGLDGAFFAHQEEIDLCWRILSRGYRIVVTPMSRVLHLGGGSLDMASPQKTYLNFRNNLLMLYKNLSSRRLLLLTFVQRLVLDSLAMFVFALQGRLQHAKAVLRAWWGFATKLPNYRANRRNNLSKMKTAHPMGLKSYSLIWGFYICKRKTFLDLDK